MSSPFPRFSELPAELRLQIWHQAMPLFVRIIEIKSVVYDERFFGTLSFVSLPGESTLPNWTITATSLPTLLLVNHESRAEMRPLPFNPAETTSPARTINISCTADTVFINLTYKSFARNFIPRLSVEIFGIVNLKTLKKELRSLAGNYLFWEMVLRLSGRMAFFSEFQKLEEIILVAQKEGCQHGEGRFEGFEKFETEEFIERSWIRGLRDRLGETFGTEVRKVRVFNGAWEEY